ncbi:MAG: hypothetical protein WCJ21_10060, partial [Planctomycetota bacterium]
MDSLTIQGTIFEIAQAQGWQERFRRAPNLGCRGLIAAATLFALLSFSSRPAWAQNATTGTTIYGTGQSGTTWTGGTISPGATLRLDDGAAVSGAPG